jgi:hypothetical protein
VKSAEGGFGEQSASDDDADDADDDDADDADLGSDGDF